PSRRSSGSSSPAPEPTRRTTPPTRWARPSQQAARARPSPAMARANRPRFEVERLVEPRELDVRARPEDRGRRTGEDARLAMVTERTPEGSLAHATHAVVSRAGMP